MSSEPNDPALRDALVQMSFEVIGRLTRLAAEEGLSLPQLRVLGVLRDRRPRMADLANVLGLDRSSVTGLIDRAQRRGLVERVTEDDDGRVVRVALTAEGERYGERLTSRMAELLEDVIAPMSAETRAALQAGLEQALVPRI